MAYPTRHKQVFSHNNGQNLLLTPQLPKNKTEGGVVNTTSRFWITCWNRVRPKMKLIRPAITNYSSLCKQSNALKICQSTLGNIYCSTRLPLLHVWRDIQRGTINLNSAHLARILSSHQKEALQELVYEAPGIRHYKQPEMRCTTL